MASPDHLPTIPVEPVNELCVTKGGIANRTITEPTVRAYGMGTLGDAAELSFVFRGDTDMGRALASGRMRRQIGLKLRASNGCNLVYVMWRLDPKPAIEVSVKSNPGMVNSEDCGARGYAKVRGDRRGAPIGLPEPGATSTLHAEIVDGQLTAWVNGKVTWHGELPPVASALTGPAGLRTDNVAVDQVQLLAVTGGPAATCKRIDREE